MSDCKHPLWERIRLCDNGACPDCLAARLAAAEADLETLAREARRFYLADGTVLDLDPEEVVRRRKQAAADLAAAERDAAARTKACREHVEARRAAERRAEEAERERDDLRAWQLAVAEPLGFVNRAEGQGGYEVAPPNAVLAEVRRAESSRAEVEALNLALAVGWKEQAIRWFEQLGEITKSASVGGDTMADVTGLCAWALHLLRHNAAAPSPSPFDWNEAARRVEAARALRSPGDPE